MFSKSRRFNSVSAKQAVNKQTTENEETKKINLPFNSEPVAKDDIVKPKSKSKAEVKNCSDSSQTKPEITKAKPDGSKVKQEKINIKPVITNTKEDIRVRSELLKVKSKTCLTVTPKVKVETGCAKSLVDAQSQCSSQRKLNPFVTPRGKSGLKTPSLLKTPLFCKKDGCSSKKSTEKKVIEDILKAQEVEIRNKDMTIAEYGRQIDELNNKIAYLQKQIQAATEADYKNLDEKLSQVTIEDNEQALKSYKLIEELKGVIANLEKQCTGLEYELCSKQVELSSLEEIICIRDSLCKDLQDKLTNVETCLEETKQRLEMVKGHHALALEANESIRREYKSELESIKNKLEEEKQNIVSKTKTEQENIKSKYKTQMEDLMKQMTEEKQSERAELEHQMKIKDMEMKAKLEQIEESSSEKLRLCEIQFEERFQSIQEHWTMQEEKILSLEKEANDLKYSLSLAEDQKAMLQQEMKTLLKNNNSLLQDKEILTNEVNDLKDESKQKFIDFENQINKLTVEVDKAMKEKFKYEMSLSVTRDIVQVLTLRLRESDNEVEQLEGRVLALNEAKDALEQQLLSYKSCFNNTVHECNEYKDALVNILKSKSALAKEHNRMMEHNVSLIDCLQTVEKEAFRELGSIKNELIEDVEMLRMESKTQIQALREEVEKKRMLCELATEHAGQATAAAEQSRVLVAQAASEITRLEVENQRLLAQIQDQQSIVVELSLLRQENEELAVTVAKQSSIIEKMKKDADHAKELSKPKSPAVLRKAHKIGKENSPIIISPLRERNH